MMTKRILGVAAVPEPLELAVLDPPPEPPPLQALNIADIAKRMIDLIRFNVI
jgi:hypothetical protein